jgi:arsenate reductase (thioredoxin)
MKKLSVLFLCTGNSFRSQMAEALLRKYAGERFEVFSAGLEPKGIHPYTRQIMAEIGLDLAGQYSKDVQDYLGKQHFDYVITLCSDADQNCPAVFTGASRRLHWGFDDPGAVQGSAAEKLEKSRQVRDQIDQKIRQWLENPALDH